MLQEDALEEENKIDYRTADVKLVGQKGLEL